jgi:hypothetical protein
VCCAYNELSSLLIVVYIASIYRTLNGLTVCPIYFNWQALRFSWFRPLLAYLSVIGFLGFNL